MKKIIVNPKTVVLSTLSLIMIILAILQPINVKKSQALEWDPVKWLACSIDGGDEVLKASRTEWIPYLLDSKTVIGGQEVGWNLSNGLLQVSGYDFIDKTKAKKTPDKLSPFDRFGFLGLKFTSYKGEWKYYDVDVCADDYSQQGESTNYGQFYEDRKEPIASYSERSSSVDNRVEISVQGWGSAIWKSLMDRLNNIALEFGKIILGFTLALISLSFTDIGTIFGLDEEFSKGIFLSLYNNFFTPLVVFMMLFTAGYIAYYGLVRKEFRQAVVGGLVKTLSCFFLAILIGTNPALITLPNKVVTAGQVIVLNALGTNFKGDKGDALCESSTSFDSLADFGSKDFLDKAGDDMRSIIGCRMWAEFLFKPFILAQFGTEYENLEKLPNLNEEWVGEPKVKLGSKEITNWGLLYVSVISGKHISIDETNSPMIGSVHKDYYRIIDALSNYDEEGNFASGSSLSAAGGDGYGAFGDFLKEGTEANKLAKEIFKIFTEEYGFSGAFAAGMLANIHGESGFIPDVGEGGKRMGMNNKDGATINTANPGAVGGGGLFQFTPYTKFSHSEYWGKINKKEGWAPENQIAFVWASEFANKSVHNSYNGNNATVGAQAAINRLGRFGSIEDALKSTDPAKASAYFQVGYERPQVYHPEREQLAIEANKVFNKKNIKADPSKWKFNSNASGIGSNGTSSGRVGGSSNIGIPVDNNPLDEWKYFIGAEQGHRFAYTNIMLGLILVGSIAPLVFAMTAAILSIGITLLTMISPIFLLLGCWGGKGNSIFMQWVGTFVSTILKKLAATGMLLISVMIVTIVMSLFNSIGFFKGFMFLLVMAFVLVRQRHEILNKLAMINFGTLNTSHFTNSVKKVGNVAKTVGEIGVVGTAGGITAKRAGGSFKSGAKNSMLQMGKNKLYTNKTGNRVITTMNALSAESHSSYCFICQKELKKGDSIWQDSDTTMIYCDDCASLNGYNNMTNTILSTTNQEKGTMTFDEEVYLKDENGDIQEYSHLTFKDAYDITSGNKEITNEEGNTVKISKEQIPIELAQKIQDSLRITRSDIDRLYGRSEKLNEIVLMEYPYIPEPLREQVNMEKVRKLFNNINNSTVSSELVNNENGEIEKVFSPKYKQLLEDYYNLLDREWEIWYRKQLENGNLGMSDDEINYAVTNMRTPIEKKGENE